MTAFGADNTPQDLYFPEDHPTIPGWFKGMEAIIHECGLWPQRGLNAQSEGFKCMAGKINCCCHQVLFTQPDFVNQKSHLEELITSWGHICDFYPKYHCKLNFIKQYWGVANLTYQSIAKTTDMKEMEKNVRECLGNVPHVLIQWWASPQIYWCVLSDILSIISYANCAARFISTYGQGLTSPEAAWANCKYHGHCTLPPHIASKLKKEHEVKYGGQ